MSRFFQDSVQNTRASKIWTLLALICNVRYAQHSFYIVASKPCNIFCSPMSMLPACTLLFQPAYLDAECVTYWLHGFTDGWSCTVFVWKSNSIWPVKFTSRMSSFSGVAYFFKENQIKLHVCMYVHTICMYMCTYVLLKR